MLVNSLYIYRVGKDLTRRMWCSWEDVVNYNAKQFMPKTQTSCVHALIRDGSIPFICCAFIPCQHSRFYLKLATWQQHLHAKPRDEVFFLMTPICLVLLTQVTTWCNAISAWNRALRFLGSWHSDTLLPGKPSTLNSPPTYFTLLPM